MPIELTCRTCGFTGDAPDTAAGHLLRCPECGHSLRAPAQPSARRTDSASGGRAPRAARRARLRPVVFHALTLRAAAGFALGGAAASVALVFLGFPLIQGTLETVRAQADGELHLTHLIQARWGLFLALSLPWAAPGLCAALAMAWGKPALRRVMAAFACGTFCWGPAILLYLVLTGSPRAGLTIGLGIAWPAAAGLALKLFDCRYAAWGALVSWVAFILGAGLANTAIELLTLWGVAGVGIDLGCLTLAYGLGGAGLGATLRYEASAWGEDIFQ